ncbi:MAG TPA: hypothetical protein VGK93_05035 [Candidatus Eisenbacteria bacterium]|jgi:hypothetical protein
MTKDQVYRVEYFAITADDQPGKGGDLGNRLKQEGVHLLGLLAFPIEGGKVQVDLVPEHPEDLRKAAKKVGIILGEPKIAFLAQGTDRAGAMSEILGRLGTAKVNITAALGVAAGGNRYGALLWVKQADVENASRALGATTMTTHRV